MLIAMKKGELDHLTRLECGREEEKCCEVILVTSQVGQAVFLASPKILKEGQAVFWFLLRLFQAGGEKFFWASPKILQRGAKSFLGSSEITSSRGQGFFLLHLRIFKELARCLFGLT